MKSLVTLATLVTSLVAVVGETSPLNDAPPPIDLSRLPGYVSSVANVAVVDIPHFEIHNINAAATDFQQGLAVINGKEVPIRLILPAMLVHSPFTVIHDVVLKQALIINGKFICGSIQSRGNKGISGLTIPIMSLEYYYFMIKGQGKEDTNPPPNPVHQNLTTNATVPGLQNRKKAPRALVQGNLVAYKFVTGPLATFKLDSLQITRGHFNSGSISHTNGSIAHLTGFQSIIAQAKENPPFRYVNASQVKKDFGGVKLIDHDFDWLNLQFKDSRILNGAYVNSTISSAIFRQGYLAFMAIYQPHNQTLHQFWNRAK